MVRATTKALARGACFSVTTGPCEGIVHEAKAAKITVGRTKASKFQIKDSSISVKHAELYLVDDVWYVKDVGSTNGSALNGDEMDDTGVAIKTGDVIRFGEESFVHVQIHEPAAAQPGTSNATAAAAATSTQHQDDAEEEQREEQEQAAAPQQQQAGPSDPAAQAGVGAAPAGAAPEPSTEAAVQPLPMASTAQLTPPEQCPAGITVEQYLLQESDRMVASIQALAQAQVDKLKQDWAVKRSAWLDLVA